MNKDETRDLVLIKYGGNAMLDEELTSRIIETVSDLKQSGYKLVIVHGGGPFIEDNLKLAGIESEFIGGHRRTSADAMKYIEMALKGHVNSKLVKEFNRKGMKAVGLSGKDGAMVKVNKRYIASDQGKKIDLGYVGDVDSIETDLLELLLHHNYTPVISTIASGKDGDDYNVNADMFAGHLAGALQVKYMIMLTDVDGLMKDPDNPESLIHELKITEIGKLKGSTIKGGMIPKTEACQIAVEGGAESALIMNGTKPETIRLFFNQDPKAKFTTIKE